MARFVMRLVVVGLMAASWSVAADPEGGEKRIWVPVPVVLKNRER